MIYLLLALLFVKHFLCDFVLQYPYMLSQKGTYGARGGIDHAIFHAAGTWLVMTPFIGIGSIIFAAADGFIHYHIDWIKCQLSKGLTVQDHKFWVWFGIDQLLHYLTYLAILIIVVT